MSDLGRVGPAAQPQVTSEGGAAEAAGPGEPGGPTERLAPRLQVAALCYRVSGGRCEVLLVTSRETGRWVLPKGWPMPGRSPWSAAAREAFEEAGVLGRSGRVCIGQYSYDKLLKGGAAVPCRVCVYPLRVGKLLPDWPERRQRVRRWMTPRKAAARVAEPELAALLAGFDPDRQGVEAAAPAAQGPAHGS